MTRRNPPSPPFLLSFGHYECDADANKCNRMSLICNTKAVCKRKRRKEDSIPTRIAFGKNDSSRTLHKNIISHHHDIVHRSGNRHIQGMRHSFLKETWHNKTQYSNHRYKSAYVFCTRFLCTTGS